MTERILDFSEDSAELGVSLQRLLVKRGEEELTIPLEEIGVLIAAHPRLHFSLSALTGICAHGGILVLCNEKRMPVGMVLPLDTHYLQTERLAAQVSASVPCKKQLWKQVIRAKVTGQGSTLQLLKGDDAGLISLAKAVRSGDPANVEGQASRRYWTALFGEDFLRDPEEAGVNSMLNYGYAVLRAIVARAICAAGLHPSMGLHHHNRYNPFCLADDLMEPYRPVVDRIVFKASGGSTAGLLLSKDEKRKLLQGLADARCEICGESKGLFDAAQKTASSLAAVFGKDEGRLALPTSLDAKARR